MDDVPLCPDWWPQLIWRLHFPINIPGGPPIPNPVNLPPEMDRIFQGLAVHTMTYSMADQKAAQAIRTQLEETLSTSIKGLSKMHDKKRRK
jgi:hypothetical protein